MAIMSWKPFWDIEGFFEDWPGRAVMGIKSPKMDIYETDKEVIAEVELPGVDPKKIDVKIEDNVLKIEARVEEKKEEKGRGYYRKELSSGYCKRAISLPIEVKEDKAKAEYKDGILRVSIPKKETRKAKVGKTVKVEVKSKKTKSK